MNQTTGGGDEQRFPCNVCNKSYLRKRHLQRHKRDECIGIEPRFQCPECPSKFRRKYHLVRHLSSKHGIQKGPLRPTVSQDPQPFDMSPRADSENRIHASNANRFSVDALMMKPELPMVDFPASLDEYGLKYAGAQLGMHQTFQNLKSLFVNYALNNIPN
jgi:uncharacterized C2H2 Zn-finger protein